MKISAVRMAEFGPFFDGVALEGMADGLNVLIGPNERGKSTVLRALGLLFCEAHSAQNKAVRACRSYQGGSPLVEAEFEMGNGRWRLRKRYLTGKSAELVALDGGQTWRNQDAEERLAALLAANQAIDGARSLLWVEQTKSFGVPSGKDQEQLGGALTGFIKKEAAVVAGGDMLQAVKALALEALDGLVTGARRQPRKGGALALALIERDRIAAELQAALGVLSQAEARLTSLSELRVREQELLSPARNARMAAETEAAQHAFEAARTAREHLAACRYKVQGAQATQDAKASEFKAVSAQVAEMERIAAELLALDKRKGEGEAALAAVDQRIAECAGAVRDAEAQVAGATAAQRNMEAAARRAGIEARHQELALRVGTALAAQARVAQIEMELAGAPVAHEDLVRLRSIEGERREYAGALAATVARLEVRYVAGVSSGFSIAGESLAEGQDISIDAPLDIEVDGVGTLSVSPGRTDEIAASRRRLALLDEERQRLLERLGVGDVEAAEAVIERQQELERALHGARAELGALAPDGVEALSGRLEALRNQIDLSESGETAGSSDAAGDGAGDAAWGPGSVARAASVLTELHEQLGILRAALAALHGERQSLMLEVQSVRLGLEHRQRRQEELQADLPERDAWQGRVGALKAELEALNASLLDVVREQEAWRARAPDDAAFEGMRQQLNEHGSRREREAEELHDVRLQISGLEGRMEELRESDVRARVEELREAHARTVRRVGDLEDEVKALVLIEQEVGRAEADLQTRVLAPLVHRLAPIAARVLDGAGFEVSGPLEISGIRRGATVAPVADLSDGTREQIAVLVRLAYARMFADLGVPVPLILDDALVFSDDARLDTMFELLAEAARVHQVLVLSCHESGFRPLVTMHGARRLEFSPWASMALTRAV